MNVPISATVLAKNSERTIGECLRALRAFDEVIVLDNGSTDQTMNIASAFPNVTLLESGMEGFGPLKNFAARNARHDWILNVDSDEILSDELVREIAHLKLDERHAYSMVRENFFNGRLIKCCGWYPDRVLRLYNKCQTSFEEKLVHESLQKKKGIKIVPLRHPMRHFSYRNASDLLDKMKHYAQLYARENAGTKKSGPLKASFHALFAFVRNYFLQRGFLYGYEGLLISVSNAGGVFYKYIMLHEANQAPKKCPKERQCNSSWNQ